MLYACYIVIFRYKGQAVMLQIHFRPDYIYFGQDPAYKSPKCPRNAFFAKSRRSQWVNFHNHIKAASLKFKQGRKKKLLLKCIPQKLSRLQVYPGGGRKLHLKTVYRLI